MSNIPDPKQIGCGGWMPDPKFAPIKYNTENAMSGNTPRTDAAWERHLADSTTDDADPWLLASTLERELTAMTDERDELIEYKHEIETATGGAMDGVCGANERHCSCVPLLRAEVKRIAAERDSLNAKLQAASEWSAALADEGDGLRSERDVLKAAIVAFCEDNDWSSEDWKEQPHIKPLFDIAKQ